MKKIIWPHGVVRILQISLITLFGYGYACAGIIVCALDIYSDRLLIFEIIFIFIAATITIFSFAKNKIILSSQEIVATGDGKKSYSLHEIVQYEVKVRYDEFSSITLNTEQPIRTIKLYVMAEPKCLAYYFTAKTEKSKS